MRPQQYASQAALAAPFTPTSDGAHGQVLARLANASHDLRDPLHVIATYMELLAGGFCGPVNGDQHTYLMRVRGHVDHLAAVIDSILILARTAQCGSALELSDVPVRALMDDVHALVAPFAAAAGVSLVLDYAHAPASVRGERTALQRVLLNLAGNALKFTPSGGRVTLSALALPKAVELRVEDTGPGIPSAQLDAIFEPFVQLHASDKAERRGAGLGLSIARELTQLMGGEMIARSTVGVGSLFAVRFRGGAQRCARVSTAKAA
jgi:signal transduction histidine kinase